MYETAVRKRLPVWAVVKRSYGYVWDHRILLSAPLLPVFAAHVASEIYSQNLGAPNLGNSLPEPEKVSKGLIWLSFSYLWLFSCLIGSAAVKSIDLAVLAVMLSLCYDVLVRGGGPTNFPQAVQR